jgi:hypothetical protein
MMRRTLMVKLKPEHSDGYEVQKMLRTAQASLRAAYGVQSVRAEYAADDETRATWDLIITMEYVSGVDEKRSSTDPIRRAFEENFLGKRADRIWSGVFDSEH